MTRTYLLDTSILSELAPGRRTPGPDFASWAVVTGPRLYVSLISVAEVTAGIAKLDREGKPEAARRYQAWLGDIISNLGDRLVAFDIAVANEAGRLLDLARSKGMQPRLADMAIAATAAVHGNTLLTRNLKHFENLGVPYADPFVVLPR